MATTYLIFTERHKNFQEIKDKLSLNTDDSTLHLRLDCHPSVTLNLLPEPNFTDEIQVIFDVFHLSSCWLESLMKRYYDCCCFYFNGHTFLNEEQASQLRKKRIVLVSMPKSGSVWMARAIESALLTRQMLSCGGSWEQHDGQSLSILDFESFLEGQSRLLNAHIAPSKFNLTIFEEALQRNEQLKLILHLRDPRQAMVSWMNFEPKIEGILGATLKAHFPSNHNYDFEHFFNGYYKKMLAFCEGWFKALDSPTIRDRVLITTHEQLATKPRELNTEVANWVGVKPDELKISKQPVAGKMHFRSGKTDEWLEVFNERQKLQLNQGLSEELKSFFNWS